MCRRRGAKRDKPGPKRQGQRHEPGGAGRLFAVKIGKKRIGAGLSFAGPVMRQRGIHQRQSGAAMKFGQDTGGKLFRRVGDGLADAGLLAGHQPRAETGRFGIKTGEIPGHMQRVCRGEGGEGQKPALDQPVDSAKGELRASDLGDAGRSRLDGLGGKPRLGAGQPGRHPVRHQRHYKSPVGRHGHDNGKLLGKLVLHRRPLRCQQ